MPITANHLDKNDGAVDLSALVMTNSNKQPNVAMYISSNYIVIQTITFYDIIIVFIFGVEIFL